MELIEPTYKYICMAHYCAAGFVKDRNRQGKGQQMRNGVLGYYVHCVVP